jgi:hypothetical protein
MMTYKQWQLLRESLGTYNLGVRTPNTVGGIYSRYHDVDKSNIQEKMFGMTDDDMGGGDGGFGGMGGGGPPMTPAGGNPPPPIPKKKKHRHHEEDDEFEDGDDFEDEDEEEDFEDDEEDEDEEEEDFEDEEDEDMPPSPEEDEMGGPRRKPPMGRVPPDHMHDQRPFMKLSRESCECDDEDGNDKELLFDDEGDDEKPSKKKDNKEAPAFLMKKKIKKGMKAESPKNDPGLKKWKKGMKAEKDECEGMRCKKCKKCKKMKAEAQNYDYYRRPRNYDDSNANFMKSISGHFGNVNQKFDDGTKSMREDLLLPPEEGQPGEARPGEVGYSPATRVGGQLGQNLNTTESVQYLMRRILELEKKLNDN